LFLFQHLDFVITSYQSAWSQSSHEDCGPSVGRLTPCPPDPSATLRDNELAGAVAQCVVHDTASQDKALWHTEPQVMFVGKEDSPNSIWLDSTRLDTFDFVEPVEQVETSVSSETSRAVPTWRTTNKLVQV